MTKYFAVATAAFLAALALSTGAFADQHYVITKSSQIKDGAVSLLDLSPDARKALKGDRGDDVRFLSAGNWGLINRNTIGSPSAFLRSGPFSPPFGKGSLNLVVGGPTEKVAYGNEIDFAGKLVRDLTAVGFRVYTTGENIGVSGGLPNMPSIVFEIDPNVAAVNTDFSSLVFVPNNSPPNAWSGYIDATSPTAGLWGLTGSKFAGTPCDLNGARCTFAQVQAYLNDGGDPATILTAAVTKGRDFAWQGAVDGLRINGTVYDFEETGIVKRHAA